MSDPIDDQHQGEARPALERTDAKAWDAFCDRLKAVGHQVLEASPPDAFDRAEGLRYVSRLTRAFLRSTIEDADPALARLNTESPKIGLDNPDYVYASSRLSSAFEYKLSGTMNDAQLLGAGSYSGGLGSPKGLICDGYLSSGEFAADDDGHFEITISLAKRPGNWLPMSEETNQLTIRQTLLERSSQQPAALKLTRVDAGAVPSALDPERFERALGRAGMMVQGVVEQFLGWSRSFQEHCHEVRELDPALLSVAQGDPNTRYFYSYWKLHDDEAFVVEFTPPECEYWNLQIGNHWLESFDFNHHRTHVNHHTAVLADDGKLRCVVARADCGQPNWLDTAAHAEGAMAVRFVGAAQVPEFESYVTPISELA